MTETIDPTYEPMTKQNEQPYKQLDQESFNSIASAFARLQALGDKQIDAGPGDNTAAEKEKLVEYLAIEMMNHIAEFLGAWQLCNMEYLPFLRTLQAVAKRAGYQPTPVPNAKAPANPANN